MQPQSTFQLYHCGCLILQFFKSTMDVTSSIQQTFVTFTEWRGWLDIGAHVSTYLNITLRHAGPLDQSQPVCTPLGSPGADRRRANSSVTFWPQMDSEQTVGGAWSTTRVSEARIGSSLNMTSRGWLPQTRPASFSSRHFEEMRAAQGPGTKHLTKGRAVLKCQHIANTSQAPRPPHAF